LSAGAPHQASAPPPASVLVRPQALRPTPRVRVAAGPVPTRLCCVLPRGAAGFPFICVLVLSCRRRPGFGRAEVVLGLAVQPPLETAAPPRLSLSFPPQAHRVPLGRVSISVLPPQAELSVFTPRKIWFTSICLLLRVFVPLVFLSGQVLLFPLKAQECSCDSDSFCAVL
jgi:hypothetical protein